MTWMRPTTFEFPRSLRNELDLALVVNLRQQTGVRAFGRQFSSVNPLTGRAAGTASFATTCAVFGMVASAQGAVTKGWAVGGGYFRIFAHHLKHVLEAEFRGKVRLVTRCYRRRFSWLR